MAQLSIVIPTLNVVPVLGPTLVALAQMEGIGLVKELIVVDGGSTDGTCEAVIEAGAGLIASEPGRGCQLQAGAAAARGDWILFLHADTELEAGWSDAIRSFINAPESSDQAGYFRFALDEACLGARRLERLVSWRNQLMGLPYGDQGLLISQALYEKVGGYRAYPLMEDVDLVRRLGRRRLRRLDVRATTSAERYRRDGYWHRPARNLLCLALYYIGFSPHLIKRVYG
jgi:rSAM/selenodomain-associated transferase 2